MCNQKTHSLVYQKNLLLTKNMLKFEELILQDVFSTKGDDFECPYFIFGAIHQRLQEYLICNC